MTDAVSRPSDQELYNQLAVYSLGLRDPEFIHQHVVDAFVVQHAGPGSKPMAIVFGLVGLYLYIEKGYTGRQVQRAHRELAGKRRSWTAPAVPENPRATTGVADVLAARAGAERAAMLRRWCEAVWQDWQHARPAIAGVARDLLGVEDHVR